MYEINRDKQTELLRWLLATLDGQWLSKTAAMYSPADASKLNSRVHTTLGRTEMKAMLSLLGKSRADNLSDAVEIIKTYLNLAYGERGFNGTFRPVQAAGGGQQRLEIEVARFSGLDNIKKVAQAAGERPGMATQELWSIWFETLLPDEQVEVSVQSKPTGDLVVVTATSDSFVAPLPLDLAPQEEISPIAAVLQIPLEPAQPAPPPARASGFGAPPANPATSAMPSGNSPASNPTEKPQGYPFTSGYNYRPEAEPTALGYSGPVEAPMHPSNLPSVSSTPSSSVEPARPATGMNEAGAARSTGGSLNQRLMRQKQGDNAEMLPHGTPPALQNQESAGLVPPGALKVNPTSGRPLFADDLDEEAKKSVEKRKPQKGLPFMSRLMISKEAREMLEQSGDEKPMLAAFSLAGGVEAALQRLVAQELAQQPGSIIEPIHVVDGPEGELQIHVGARMYSSVGDVPPGQVRELLQQAVDEWFSSQGS